MTTPSTPLYDWGSDTNFASGDESGNPVKDVPTAGEAAQGFVPGVEWPSQWANEVLQNYKQWIEHAMDRVEDLGDGSDGDITISSGTTTLTRDMQYNSLTVDGTGVLDTAGFRVLSRTTITIDVGGTISVQPGDAGTIRAGRIDVNGGSTGSPGAAGSGTDALGGDGGAGGSASAAGGAGGTAAQPAITHRRAVARLAIDGYVSLYGGASGGGGSGGSGDAGGDGGQGGGIVYLACVDLIWSGGDIVADAADGDPGVAAGNGGGGGGGGGGCVYLRRRTETGTPSISVAGGAGGLGDGTGNPGAIGSAGVEIREDI